MNRFEKILDIQRKELEEKNSKISSLEIKLDELQKNFSDDRKNKEKKIKELESLLKS